MSLGILRFFVGLGILFAVSKLLIDSEFWESKDEPKSGAFKDQLRSRRRRSQLMMDDDPQALMESYLEAIDAGGPSELQSGQCHHLNAWYYLMISIQFFLFLQTNASPSCL